MQIESKNFLKGIVNMHIHSIKAGLGTGSIFTMYFVDEYTSRSDDTVAMVTSSWKLINNNIITCSWKDSEEYLAEKLSELSDKVIENIIILNTGDLYIKISNSNLLYIFSDGSKEDIDENAFDWYIKKNNLYCISYRGAVRISE